MDRLIFIQIVLGFFLFLVHVSSELVCIVGSGISGSSAAHFIRAYSNRELEIEIYEKNSVVGGRMAMVDLADDEFEAGASILHPKNYHAVRFTDLLGLKRFTKNDDDDFGIWDGEKFVLRTLKPGRSFISQQWTKLVNTLTLLSRYKTSLFKLQKYVSALLERFLHYYDEPRPIFFTVEEMLKWADLYELTQISSERDLLKYGLSRRLINELGTVIMRINYGQNMSISGMAGAVSLCGSGGDLWAVEGGNWQIASGLIKLSNASIFLNEAVTSISYVGNQYQMGLASGRMRLCDAVIVATFLDEVQINFNPPISLPERHMQHTFTTFVRGLINSEYFGISSIQNMPNLIGTLEIQTLPFSSINVLKDYSAEDKAYKIFSRAPLSDTLLDELFSYRTTTVRVDWAAYPHYNAPEKFAPILLDGNHLYYINAFESAASTIETGAVAAENVARLLLARLSGGILKDWRQDGEEKNFDL